MLRRKLKSPVPPGGARPSDAARVKVLEDLVAFIRHEDANAVFEIKLYKTDAEARAGGWESAAAQKKDLQEIIRTLPVDVAHRIKLV